MPLFRGLFVRKDSTRGTTPVEARKALASMFAPLGATGARPGLLSGGNVAGTSGWAYSVPAFHAVLTRGAADGVVLMGNDGPINAPTDPAPATGSRIDIVYVRHADVDAGDPTSAPAVDVAKGAASGTPQAPALPAGALELARATVSSSATSTQHAGVTITQTAQRTAPRGVPVRVQSMADAAAYRAAHVAAGGLASEALAALPNTDWIAATLQGEWQNFGGSYRDAAYCRINGVVFVRGMIKGGTHVTPGTVLLNLPPGFRPAKFDVYPAWGASAAAALELGPNGNLVVGDVNISAVRTSINVTFVVEA